MGNLTFYSRGFCSESNQARSYLIALLAWGIILFGSFNPLSADVKPIVKIGAVLSLSGGLDQWCNFIRRGVELAADEDGSVKVEVIFEDDRSVDKRQVLAATQKLLQLNKVDLLYSWTPTTAPIIASLAIKAKTPVLFGAYDRFISQAGPHVFGAFVNYDLAAKEIANFFVNDKKAKRIGILIAAEHWSKNFEKPFREQIQKLGASIEFLETIPPDEVDTRSVVTKLKRAKIDAVLAPLFGASLVAFVRQANELHYSGIIHVADGMFERDIQEIGLSAEGVYASQIYLESPHFKELYRNKFGAEADPLQLGIVATGYDWVRHVKDAATEMIRDGVLITPESLSDKLASFKSEGYLGQQMYGAAPVSSGEIIMVVKNGRYVRTGN